jgi:hypothetical protein
MELATMSGPVWAPNIPTSENSENSKNSEKTETAKKRINVQMKGKVAERDIARIFYNVCLAVEATMPDDSKSYLYASEEIKRNTLQSDRGGFDIVGLPLLAPEVKFVEKQALNTWWSQCMRQVKRGLFPCLFYKSSRKKWRVRSYVSLQHPLETEAMHWVVADYDLADFMQWYSDVYRLYLLTTD